MVQGVTVVAVVIAVVVLSVLVTAAAAVVGGGVLYNRSWASATVCVNTHHPSGDTAQPCRKFPSP